MVCNDVWCGVCWKWWKYMKMHNNIFIIIILYHPLFTFVGMKREKLETPSSSFCLRTSSFSIFTCSISCKNAEALFSSGVTFLCWLTPTPDLKKTPTTKKKRLELKKRQPTKNAETQYETQFFSWGNMFLARNENGSNILGPALVTASISALASETWPSKMWKIDLRNNESLKTVERCRK